VLFIKDVRSQGRKSEIYGVSAWTRGEEGLSHCGYFADKESQFFAILSGHLLWTAPYGTFRSARTWEPSHLKVNA